MRRGTRIATATLATAVLVPGATVAHDPYLLVRAQFERQRLVAGLHKATVQVAEHRWAYAYLDDAPTNAPVVVMLHGFTGSKENWYPLAKRLRGKYRLLIPDLPGWGESERKPGGGYGYIAQAERVDAFIRSVVATRYGMAVGDDAGGGDSIVLLGHSMGGGIAALVATQHPGDIARLGLLDAAGVRLKDNVFGKQMLDGENPFAVSDRASLQHYVDTVFHRDVAKPWIPWPASRSFVKKRIADADFEQSVLDSIGRCPECFAPGDAATDIHQPTLLLWGRDDAVVDPSAMDLYAANIPQARKVLVDDCGHMSLVEQPDAVAAAVHALIEEMTE